MAPHSPGRQAEARQFVKLSHSIQTLQDRRNVTISDPELESLGVTRSTCLDVDDPSPLDMEPRFFRPFAGVSAESTNEESMLLRQRWRGRMNKPPREIELNWRLPGSPSPRWVAIAWNVCSENKAEQFISCFTALHTSTRREPCLWEGEEKTARNGYLTVPYEYALYAPYRCKPPEYITSHVLIPRDKKTPHTAIAVCDETVAPGDEMLMSEVDAALRLAKERLRKGDFTDHHTKPVLVFSFQSETHARITQAHYNAKIDKLVLRQSRLLDLQGDEPSADAYILLSWVLNTPVGETLYATRDGDGHDYVEQTISPQKSVMAGGQ